MKIKNPLMQGEISTSHTVWFRSYGDFMEENVKRNRICIFKFVKDQKKCIRIRISFIGQVCAHVQGM